MLKISDKMIESYEEGTWTPTDNNAVAGTLHSGDNYVKIGNIVTLTYDVTLPAGYTGTYGNILVPWVSISQVGATIGYNTGGAVSSYISTGAIYFMTGGTTYVSGTVAQNKRFIGQVTYKIL